MKRKPPVFSWRPQAADHEQKLNRALKAHHRARRIAGKNCVVPYCKKTQILGSEYCAKHHCLRMSHVPASMEDDRIVYGEKARAAHE
jgi:hypothetical protein